MWGYRVQGPQKGQFSFLNLQPERVRWEANTKTQHIKNSLGERRLPVRSEVETSK